MPDPIRRRDEKDTERELHVDKAAGERPGGAEGGEASNSAKWLVDHPDDTDPLGDTDQHSDPQKVPPRREPENRE